MDVSVVVVNWNSRDLLRDCLRSAYENSGRMSIEVLVVDNASTDGSSEMVAKEFPQVRLIRNEENLGFSKANNQAIKVSHGRYVLLLNNDAYLLPGSLEKMVRFMDSRPEVCHLSPSRWFNPEGMRWEVSIHHETSYG